MAFDQAVCPMCLVRQQPRVGAAANTGHWAREDHPVWPRPAMASHAETSIGSHIRVVVGTVRVDIIFTEKQAHKEGKVSQTACKANIDSKLI